MDSTKERDNILTRFGSAMGNISMKYMPDAATFAVIFTIIAFVGGIVLAKQTPMQMVGHWYTGFWSLLAFSMQIALGVTTGSAIAHHPTVKRWIRAACDKPKTGAQGAALACVFGILAHYIHWGLGIIVGAIASLEIARALRRKDVKFHYGLIVAAGFTGEMCWHGGLSASVGLTIAQPGHFLEAEMGVIPFINYLVNPMNIILLIAFAVIPPVICYVLHPKEDKCPELRPETIAVLDEPDVEAKKLDLASASTGDRISHSKILGWALAAIGWGFLINHQPLSRMERALEVLQSLEPAGVAARDLSECLRLQLLRLRPVDKLALTIATDHLDALAKHHYGYIARQLGADQEAVERSCRLIRTLNPRPASGFESPEHVVYITPDVIATVRGGRLELVVNDRIVPVLGISAYYIRMLKAGDAPEVREYLTEKVRQAKYLLQAVEQRKSTLLACARCIAEIQQDFFRKGAGSLVPMSLQDVARRVGIHESTVSRAVGNKYLQCPSGLYPFRVFFSRGLGGETGGKASPDAAKALLKELIQQEDKARPLSDQKLCGCMAARGCAISRRTVAKYRGELQIPGMSQRRTRGG